MNSSKSWSCVVAPKDRSDVAKTVKELCGIMKTVKEMEGALSEVEELVEGENAELATTKVRQDDWNGSSESFSSLDSPSPPLYAGSLAGLGKLPKKTGAYGRKCT